MKILLIKNLGSLKPADDDATEALKKWKQGTVVSCEVKKPRNIQFHRKYFALLSIVVDNQERFVNTSELLDAIKFELGYIETRRKMDGSFYQVPRSISFAKMDDDSFGKFYSASIDVILAQIMPGVDRDDLEQEVLNFT